MKITEEMVNREFEKNFNSVEDVDVSRILELLVSIKGIEKDATC
ncbi:MAG: hypothetical protein Q8933_09375 [Bacteroidota bacterium]|nr:hypothetical protein [Bacteroidota bacterium]